MLFLAVGLWLLSRQYAGINHDALIYSLQAFARLHPQTVGQDVFLAHGSQDAFSLFGIIYAAAIRWLGLERAALVLTLCGQAWWLAGAALVARRMLAPAQAALALALLAAWPGYYGAFEVFRYAEPYITARLFAEAAVLSSVAAFLYGRAWIACALALAAMAVHPLMAMPGVLVLAIALMGQRAPALVSTTVVAGLLAAVLVALVIPHYPLSIFDEVWLTLATSRSPFLLASDWNAETWSLIALTLAAGLLAVEELPAGDPRRLVRAGLVIGALGILVTIVGATLFKVVLLVQGQAWRWIWLTQVLALIATACAAPAAWSKGTASRAPWLLLATALLLFGWPSVAASATSVCLWALRNTLPAAAVRAVWLASVALVVSASAAYAFSPLARVSTDFAASLSAMAAAGVPGVGLVLVVWLASRTKGFRVIGAAFASVVLIGAALLSWMNAPASLFGTGPHMRTAEWRAAVPPTSEVFWPSYTPAVWFLLDRASYLSNLQAAGILFSRQAAMEMLRRSTFTSPSLPKSLLFSHGAAGTAFPLARQDVQRLCASGEIGFLVSDSDLLLPAAAAPVRLPISNDGDEKTFWLYSCPEVISGPAPGR